MGRNYGQLLNEQLANSPLVQETDKYMETQVLNPEAPSVNVPKEDIAQTQNKQETSAPVQEVVTAKPEKKAGAANKKEYPAPFVNGLEGAAKHCQALVDPSTYTNMTLLKSVGAVNPSMSFGAMATEALTEWVDRKIKEWQKNNAPK